MDCQIHGRYCLWGWWKHNKRLIERGRQSTRCGAKLGLIEGTATSACDLFEDIRRCTCDAVGTFIVGTTGFRAFGYDVATGRDEGADAFGVDAIDAEAPGVDFA